MDYILLNFKDFVLVSVVETVVILMFGILLINGKAAIKERGFIIRFAIAVIGIALLERIARMFVNNIAVIAYLSTLSYVFGLKFAIGFNWRTSIIVAGLSMSLLIVTENLTAPYMVELMEKFNTAELSNSFVRFRTTLYPRSLQSIVVMFIYYSGITLFDKQLLTVKWSKLTRKVTIYYTVIIVYLNILFCANYGDIYGKVIQNLVDTTYIFTNINIILFQTVASFIFLLISYYRTSDLEIQREILNADPNNMFDAMLIISTPSQRAKFKASLEKYEDTTLTLKGGEDDEKVHINSIDS